MEVVGYECYANGTVKLKIMPFKESKRDVKPDEQFYGCEISRSKSPKNMKEKKRKVWHIGVK